MPLVGFLLVISIISTILLLQQATTIDPEHHTNPSPTPDTFQLWSGTAEQHCSGHFVGYDHEFAQLTDVIVDRSFSRCQRQGGEPVATVLGQPKSVEFCSFESGFFRVPCDRVRAYLFYNEVNHLRTWIASTIPYKDTDNDDSSIDHHVDGFTVAVTRYEYTNLYHTMTDWYNVFLITRFFGTFPHRTNILIVDVHPSGLLDPVWTRLFNSSFRLTSLPTRTRFRRLVWGLLGYESPMKISAAEDEWSAPPPLYDDFRSFFLSAHDVDDRPSVDCSRPLSVRFVWRRDNVTHAQNPSGLIHRKIRNEDELIAYVRRRRPDVVSVVGAQLDAMTMTDQLRFVVGADVLVGVHGAGLTHALFLPAGAALVEISPNLLWYSQGHFDAIASWRRLVYRRWLNSDPSLEHADDGSLTVPPSVVDRLIAGVVRRMCGGDGAGEVETDVKDNQLEGGSTRVSGHLHV